MPGNRVLVECRMYAENLMEVNSSRFEETGSITLRLLHKYQIEQALMNGDTIIVQELDTTRTSHTISKEIQLLCCEEFTDYSVRRMFETLEVNPRFIDHVKTGIVSTAVQMAIDTRTRGLKQFGLVADIEIRNIREVVQEREDLQRVLLQSMEERISKRNPASKSSIEKLKKGHFEGGGVGDDELVMKNCAVCLDDFEIGLEVIWMPCSHMFHEGCLLRWLKESKSCPLCRLELTD